jgi:hypothetical protein
MQPVTLSDEWVSWQSHGLDQRSLVADPLFVDPAQDNYALQPESPAWELGFQALPMDRMGPYESPQRASWPIVEHAGARENGVAVPVAIRHGVR